MKENDVLPARPGPGPGELLAADAEAMLGRCSLPRALARTLILPRMRAIVCYRLAHELVVRPSRLPARRAVANWLTGRGLRASGAEIHADAVIGPGLVLVHSAGVVIGGYTRAGANCRIHQGVTLGSRYYPDDQPTIGDDVVIGASAVLLGKITIGRKARIGAGAVVLEDVPAGHTAVGNPARILEPVYPVVRSLRETGA